MNWHTCTLCLTDKVISDNPAVRNSIAKKILIQNNNQVLDFLHVHFVPVEPINDAIGLCELGYRYRRSDIFSMRNLGTGKS